MAARPPVDEPIADGGDESEPYLVTPTQFRRAVTAAAIEYGRIHRRRLMYTGIAVGFITAAVVSLVVVFFTAKTNCRAISQLATATEERFVEGRKSNGIFLKESKDRFGLTETEYQELIAQSERQQQHEIDTVNGVRHRNCSLL